MCSVFNVFQGLSVFQNGPPVYPLVFLVTTKLVTRNTPKFYTCAGWKCDFQQAVVALWLIKISRAYPFKSTSYLLFNLVFHWVFLDKKRKPQVKVLVSIHLHTVKQIKLSLTNVIILSGNRCQEGIQRSVFGGVFAQQYLNVPWQTVTTSRHTLTNTNKHMHTPLHIC